MSSLVTLELSRQLPVVKKSDTYHYFNRIRIKDSTRYAVPKEYASIYKGQGGIGTSAQISIQIEYDLFSGVPIALELTSACRNDQQDSKETLGDIQKGDLLIRDWAYTSKKYIEHVTKVEAYYLNRLNPTWNIYDKYGVRLSLAKIHKRLKRYALPYVEVKASWR
jgi:Transposase DDE domain